MRGLGDLPAVLGDEPVDRIRDAAEIRALHVREHVEDRLHVVVVQRERRGRATERREIAQQLRLALAGHGDRHAVQIVHRADAVLWRLDDDRIPHAVLVVQPEILRRRAAASQRDRQAVGDVLTPSSRSAWATCRSVLTMIRGESRICCTCTSTAPGTPDSSCEICCAICVVLVALLNRPADLDVDRGGQPEVEDLADDVGRLGEELQVGKPPRQLLRGAS